MEGMWSPQEKQVTEDVLLIISNRARGKQLNAEEDEGGIHAIISKAITRGHRVPPRRKKRRATQENTVTNKCFAVL